MSCPDEALGAFPITDANPVGTDPRQSAAFCAGTGRDRQTDQYSHPVQRGVEKLAQACATVLRDEGKDLQRRRLAAVCLDPKRVACWGWPRASMRGPAKVARAFLAQHDPTPIAPACPAQSGRMDAGVAGGQAGRQLHPFDTGAAAQRARRLGCH